MQKITANRVKELRDANHVAFIYPRKQVVVVDGSKYFSISKNEISKLNK